MEITLVLSRNKKSSSRKKNPLSWLLWLTQNRDHHMNFIILSSHAQSQFAVFGRKHHRIHYMMAINKGLKPKKYFFCLILRNFISPARKSRNLENFNAFLRPCLHSNGNIKLKPAIDIKTKYIQMRKGFTRSI